MTDEYSSRLLAECGELTKKNENSLNYAAKKLADTMSAARVHVYEFVFFYGVRQKFCRLPYILGLFFVHLVEVGDYFFIILG